MPAFRIYLNNGESYVTSMAKGITLEDAEHYFLDEVIEWGSDYARIIKVEQL